MLSTQCMDNRNDRHSTAGSATLGQVGMVSLAVFSVSAWTNAGDGMHALIAHKQAAELSPSSPTATPELDSRSAAGIWGGITYAERLLKAGRAADEVRFPPHGSGGYPEVPVQLLAPRQVDDATWHEALRALSQPDDPDLGRQRAAQALMQVDAEPAVDLERWSALTVAAIEDLRAKARVGDDDAIDFLDDDAERAYFSLARPEVLAEFAARANGPNLLVHFAEVLELRGRVGGGSQSMSLTVQKRLDDALARRFLALARVFGRGDATLSPQELAIARRSLSSVFGEQGDVGKRIYRALDISPRSFEGLHQALSGPGAQSDWRMMLQYALSDNGPSSGGPSPASGQLPPDLLVGLFAEARTLIGNKVAADIYRRRERGGLTYTEDERFRVIENASPQALSGPIVSPDDLSESSRWFQNLVQWAGGGRAAEQFARRVAAIKKVAGYQRESTSHALTADELRLFGIEPDL